LSFKLKKVSALEALTSGKKNHQQKDEKTGHEDTEKALTSQVALGDARALNRTHSKCAHEPGLANQNSSTEGGQES
jgi:hypothetical protein